MWNPPKNAKSTIDKQMAWKFIEKYFHITFLRTCMFLILGVSLCIFIVFIHWHKTWAQVFQNSSPLLFTDHEMGRRGKKFTWGSLPNMLGREAQVFFVSHCSILFSTWFHLISPDSISNSIANTNKGLTMVDGMRCKFLSTAYPRQDLWATNPINIDELEGIKLTRG